MGDTRPDNLTITLPPEVMEMIARMAEYNQVTKSEMIRRFILNEYRIFTRSETKTHGK